MFIPVAFTGGMAGRMYQQFAITIAVSVVISGAVALTFTPALCALLLKPGHGEPNVFFRKFNGWFEGLTGKYVSIVKLLLRRSLLAVGLFVLVLVGIGGVFERVPGGLVPDEDQAVLHCRVQKGLALIIRLPLGKLADLFHAHCRPDGHWDAVCHIFICKHL